MIAGAVVSSIRSRFTTDDHRWGCSKNPEPGFAVKEALTLRYSNREKSPECLQGNPRSDPNPTPIGAVR